MIEHPQAPQHHDASGEPASPQVAGERSGEPEHSDNCSLYHELMRKTLSDDLWFGFEADMDMAHIWFTADQGSAVSVPVDDELDLLVDEETEALIGFTLEDFRERYRRQLPRWEQWLHSAHMRRSLERDIPMTRVVASTSEHRPANFARLATTAALERLMAARDVKL